MDYLIERDGTGAPRRLVWVPPDQRPTPPPKPPVGTFRVRLRDGPETAPIPVDASRGEIETAVKLAVAG